MKKLVLSIALVTAGIFAMNAQKPQPQPACCTTQQECCSASEQCCTQQKNKPQKPNALEGITLTAEQQKSIDELNTKYAEQRREAGKADKENKANRRQQAQESKKAYLDEMKKILTPEQYTTYLENMALTSHSQNMRKPKANNKRDGKNDNKNHRKPGKNNNRPVRLNQAQQQAQ